MKNFVLKKLVKLFPKGWGFYLCKECAKREMKRDDIDQAISEGIEKGALIIDKEHSCQFCKQKSELKLDLEKGVKLL